MASIVQRNNRYNVVYLYDDEATGKRKQKWESFKTMADAKRRKERQFVYEQYKVLSDDSRSESDVDVVLIKPDNPENIEEFGNNMKAVIAELFREAVGLAQYVYEECFVNGRDVEEILSDDPRKTEAILATYMLFLNNGNGDVGMPS